MVLVQPVPGLLEHAGALPVLTGDADAAGGVVLGIDQHDVGDVDRALLLHDATGFGGAGTRALVALDDVQALDVDPLLLGVHSEDTARLATILAADHDDLVIATHLHPRSH